MTEVAALVVGALDAPFANLAAGGVRSRREFVADAIALAERLPPSGAMLNLSIDRYRFAVGLAAALLRSQTSLLPPNHLADTVARLRARFEGVYALVDGDGDGHGLPTVRHADRLAAGDGVDRIPTVDARLVAARVLTSGGAATASEGTDELRAMVRRAGDRLTIVAGGGVRANNAREIVERTGVTELHARCSGDPARIRGIVDAVSTATPSR